MDVKTFEKLNALPDPPNTRTDTKPVFLKKADAFNPALKALVDQLNASFIDNLNALVALLNRQLPYINTVGEADAAIRANANNMRSINVNATHMEAILAVALRDPEIQAVFENLAAVIASPSYAARAEEAAIRAESVSQASYATPQKAGIVMPEILHGLSVGSKGELAVSLAAMLDFDAEGRITIKSVPLHAETHRHGGTDEVATETPGPHAIPKAGADGRLGSGWLPEIPHPTAAISIVNPFPETIPIGQESVFQGVVTSLLRDTMLAKVRVAFDAGHDVHQNDGGTTRHEELLFGEEEVLVSPQSPSIPLTLGESKAYWAAIAYGDGVWIAAGNAGKLCRSTDKGRTWKTVLIQSYKGAYDAIAYGDGVWMAVSGRSVIARSTDKGKTWDTLTISKSNSLSWYDVAYGEGVWIAVGEAGYYSRSTDDGQTWSKEKKLHDGNTSLFAIGYGEGVWIAAGQYASVARSTDKGETWELKEKGNNFWYDVAYGNGLWIGAGSTSLSLSRDKGQTWQNALTASSSVFKKIAYVHGVFIALTSDGNCYYSLDDCQNWNFPIKITSVGLNQWNSLAYGENLWIATGADGYYSRILVDQVLLPLDFSLYPVSPTPPGTVLDWTIEAWDEHGNKATLTAQSTLVEA